jgi:hypothetical protein
MKNVVVSAAFLASLVLASTAYADVIDYGSVDTLIGDGTSASGGFDKDSSTDCGTLSLPRCEEAKIEGALGGNYGDLKQIDTTTASWVAVDDGKASTNLVAFDLSAFGFTSNIGVFAIKLGNGNTAGDDFFVFNNLSNFGYALIDLNSLTTAGKYPLTTDMISHIATVPEPASLLLIGVGALTAAAARRRQRSRQGQVISLA